MMARVHRSITSCVYQSVRLPYIIYKREGGGQIYFLQLKDFIKTTPKKVKALKHVHELQHGMTEGAKEVTLMTCLREKKETKQMTKN